MSPAFATLLSASVGENGMEWFGMGWDGMLTGPECSLRCCIVKCKQGTTWLGVATLCPSVSVLICQRRRQEGRLSRERKMTRARLVLGALGRQLVTRNRS